MKKKNINKIIEEYKVNDSCLMLYDLHQLKTNIKNIISLKEKYNIDFIFPVKAFPNHKILKLFYDFNFGFDIANENEYMMIKDIIKKDTLISFNGPSIMFKQLDFTNVIYNLNSLNEVNNNEFYNGIRINTYLKSKTEFSRFGIAFDEICKINVSGIKSISFHFYEKDKNKKVKYIKKWINNCIKIFPRLNYINLGGNWDVTCVNNLEKVIIDIRKIIDKRIKIIFEIGENWFENCGYLITKVIGKNEIGNKKIFYINAVKDSVAKWSVLKPMNLSIGKQDGYVSIISGNSCYEKDVFSVINNNINLSIDDKLVFTGLNGYSYAWCKEFNGSNPPEVLFYE